MICIIFHRNNPEDTKFVFDNGKVLHKSQCERSFGEWLQAILDFSASLKSMDLDLSAFACLSALTIITGTDLYSFSNYLFIYSYKY